MNFDAWIPSPIEEIITPLTQAKGIKFFIKRDDLIHPLVSGNKYRKLKYNLLNVKTQGKSQVISFGGAFSNHIHALAAACHHQNIQSVGIIRGEIDENNPTLKYCKSVGMELVSVSREAYRSKEFAPEIKTILAHYPDAVLIPEGGSNEYALKGVAEIIEEVSMFRALGTPDYIALAGGTGGTTAGLLRAEQLKSKVLCFSALKSDHLEGEILKLARNNNAEKLAVNTDYHFGGYAKWDATLLAFMEEFENATNIPLDHVYNAKAMYGLMELISQDYFSEGTKILYLHTGGLQGRQGLEYMMRHK
ncbi:MAG: pyridoxal-phosphate dependent enzyme [Chitinophagales bacterium]|nr:pyridoxal-phosphate dependent enzyme [Chitinophagales bacterium]